MTTIRPVTCSGSSSWISRSAATWPSYSSPWLPPRDEHRRPVAVRDRRDRDEAVGPAAGVRDLRELQPADLLAGRGEVDRAGDLRRLITRAASAAATAASVASSRRSTSSSVCAYGEVAALQVQRQLEDPVLDQLAAVADEQLDVVAQQVVVARDGRLQEVRDEDRAEAGRRRPGRRAARRASRSPVAGALAEAEDVLVHRLALQLLDRRERRRGRRRVTVEGAGEEGRRPGRRARRAPSGRPARRARRPGSRCPSPCPAWSGRA